MLSNLTHAQVVNDIKIKGLQRVEPGVIFDSIPFDIGDDVSEIDPSEIIRFIYKSGQFRDVRALFGDWSRPYARETLHFPSLRSRWSP